MSVDDERHQTRPDFTINFLLTLLCKICPVANDGQLGIRSTCLKSLLNK